VITPACTGKRAQRNERCQRTHIDRAPGATGRDSGSNYATDRAAQVLNDFARANDPFKAVGERSVSVEVTSVVRASDSSFQVKWTEQTWQGGSLAKTERWTGIFSIVIRQPRDVATLRKNPLGIYVHGLDWSRELNPGETP